MTALLEIRDLLIERLGKIVLSVQELDINKGEVLAVVGPNGAGKSTLLLTLARLLHPKTGEIRFRGIKAKDESDLSYRRRIALVLQDPLLLDMSVFDNVASGLRFRRMERSKIKPLVDTWLDRLGILDLKTRRATEISGGEAQRVSLARAFVLKPDLLLLDEPFSALDPPTHERLLTEIKTLLIDTHTTTVFITHDLNEATRLGERMAIILNGVLKQTGTPEMIMHDSKDPEIIAFTRQ